jgi:tRNA nucleotidyltransferase/poly(A) polymerase
MSDRFDRLKAEIPLPGAVYALDNLFNAHDADLYGVGGFVRDFGISHFHGGDFDPKDVDLATEADPDKVLRILNSQQAKKLGISAYPKGVSFGVVSAVLDEVEYEIATFREEWYDPDVGDGRRPDEVVFSTPAKDAARRDLTINALFYHLHEREIRDYNLNEQGLGQGLDDLKNLVVRPVGVARDRFREDKLRIPRLVRFYHRFKDSDISLDPDTLNAIEEFRDLKGVSPERIANEFSVGLQKARNPAKYVQSYEALGLMPAVLGVVADIEKIGRCRNLKAVLAWLLKGREGVRKHLNKLKYPNDVSDRVEFLQKLYLFNVDKVAHLLRQRDLYKQLEGEQREQALAELVQDIRDFAEIAGASIGDMDYFLAYQPVAKSEDFMHLAGPEIGKAMARYEAQCYLDGLVGVM